MIKIGIESCPAKLRHDILTHPARYFFILFFDGRFALCIRTCDSQGEDIREHMIDGLSVDSEGNLSSVFEQALQHEAWELVGHKIHSGKENEYPISRHLEGLIFRMPDLVDWIVSSLLTGDRNIILYSAWRL